LVGDHLARALGASGLDTETQLRLSRTAVHLNVHGLFTDER
jgi:hypothetical protein